MLIRTSATPGVAHRRGTYRLEEEPPNLRGLLFMQNKDASVEVLRYSGETIPGGPPDIPPEAVTEQGVFISVNGIGQDWKSHRSQIKDWFHGGADYGVELPGPVIGIHEGERKSPLHDGLRILKNTVLTKAIQSGKSAAQIRDKAYRNDPSVKTIHDQLAQSLKASRQVTLMAHSGGASQVALALALLVDEGGPSARTDVAEKVRVLGTAPATHRNDLEWAGVKPDNLMITGSRRDPVYRFYRNHLNPERPWSALKFLGDGLCGSIGFALQPGPYHDGFYIFAGNQEDGRHKIGEFLQGGPGADSPLP